MCQCKWNIKIKKNFGIPALMCFQKFPEIRYINPLHAKYAYMCMGVVKKKRKEKKRKKRCSIAGIEPVTTGSVD